MTDEKGSPVKDAPEKVFCVDCKHHERIRTGTFPDIYTYLCRFGPQYEPSYVTREKQLQRVQCHLKNPNGECGDYEKKESK